MLANVIVKSVIINRNLKRALLIRRRSDDLDGGAWESAGGKLEEGETLEEGIAREVFEETGLNILPEIILYASVEEREDKNLIFIVYLCYTEEMAVILSDEHDESRWVDKSECRKLLKGGIAEDYIRHGVYEIEW